MVSYGTAWAVSNYNEFVSTKNSTQKGGKQFEVIV